MSEIKTGDISLDNPTPVKEFVMPDLTHDELKKAYELVPQIDISDSILVLKYGHDAQVKANRFSSKLIPRINADRASKTFSLLSELSSIISSFGSNNLDFSFANSSTDRFSFIRFIKRIFARKDKKALVDLFTNFNLTKRYIEEIAVALEEHALQLLQDISDLSRLEQENFRSFKMLSLYILAGEKRIDEIKQNELLALKSLSGRSLMDAENYKKLSDEIEKFERKLAELKASRIITTQIATQIVFLKDCDNNLYAKLQYLLNTTVPLWKKSMLLALHISDANKTFKNNHSISLAAKQSLKESSIRMKKLSEERTRDMQSGVIDINKFNDTNEKLLKAVEEAFLIQKDEKSRYAMVKNAVENISLMQKS